MHSGPSIDTSHVAPAVVKTVYHYDDGTTVVVIGGVSSGTICTAGNDTLVEGFGVEPGVKMLPKIKLAFGANARDKACSAHDTARLHRLTVCGRQQRAKRRHIAGARNVDERARGPPLLPLPGWL